MSEYPAGFNPETMVAVHDYRQVEDKTDLAPFQRALEDCQTGAPNAGKSVCFLAGYGGYSANDYDLSSED